MNLIEIEDFKSEYQKEMTRLMNFSEDEEDIIDCLNLFRIYKKGAILVKKGQFSNMSYYVIKGCLKSYNIIDGEEKITDFFEEKSFFSSTCIITNKPSEIYLECIEDTLVSVGTPESEKILLEKFPRFEKMCRIYSETTLVEQKLAFELFKISSPEQRYINFSKERPGLEQRIPQYQIASYLGLTPQSLSRIRKRLLKIKSEIKVNKIAV